MRLPRNTRTYRLVSLHLMIQPCSFPIPKNSIATCISRTQPFPIWRKGNIRLKSSISVSREDLLPLCSEAICGTKHLNCIVERLSCDMLPTWMYCDFYQRMHVWLGDVFDGNIDTVLPCSKRLIVRGGDEPFIFIAEGNGVDGGKMVVIFLD